jgi:cytochrome P450
VNFDTLEAQLPFCQALVKENMRCKGPVSGYIHNLETDISSFVCSNGLTIDASKGFININLEGIHHHPEYYEDPWVFRPERWIEKDTPAAEWLEKITTGHGSSGRCHRSSFSGSSSGSSSSSGGIAATHCSTARQLQSMEESYMPFGAGPRICPGNKMSLVEQLIAVVYLVMFFDIELGCAKEEIQRVCSVTSPPNKMPILLTPRRTW